MRLSKNPSESKVEMTQLVLPEHTNALGTIFGGQVMAWIDIAASICAFRHCRTPCVTASMDALDFISPVKLGYIVIIQANLNYAGRTSMEIGVKVNAEDPYSGNTSHTASAYLTFVSLDTAGRPIEVPEINPQSDLEKKWYQDALQRRAARHSKKN